MHSDTHQQTLPGVELPPLYRPLAPRPGSAKRFALEMLLDGPLNCDAFYEVLGSQRLAAVIHDLRSIGWPIGARDVFRPTVMIPTRLVSEYFLEFSKMDMAHVAKELAK